MTNRRWDGLRTLVATIAALQAMQWALLTPCARAQSVESVGVRAAVTVGASSAADSTQDVLLPQQWQRVDAAVDRALDWLVGQQRADGSFPSIDNGQPGVTSLAMMAFIAHGHVPGEGPYGDRLERATDYILSCQKENGLLALVGPEGPRISRKLGHEVATCTAYNHAIASLAIAELYGMSQVERAERIKQSIDKALAASLEMQHWPKDLTADRGGWRYLDEHDAMDSDLSITGWELMFLRSARNAGFSVPKGPINEAVAYVRRCYTREQETFEYVTGGGHVSRGMAGAGILALAHAGFHDSPEAHAAGRWVLRHGFSDYNRAMYFQPATHDRYHYGLFNCCQGMYQLGGDYWRQFFPPAVEILLQNQQPDGSWPTDSHWHDSQFGTAYTTALALLTLGAPNQLLPIFQR